MGFRPRLGPPKSIPRTREASRSGHFQIASFHEHVGQYQPRTGDKAINLDNARVNYWLNVGAQPTDTVRSLLRKAGLLKERHETRLASKLQANAVPLGEKAEEA